MKFKQQLSVFALFSCAAVSSAQAIVTSYSTSASFNAAVTGEVSYGFNGIVTPPNTFVNGPQTVGGVTFNSNVFPFTLASPPYGNYGVGVFSGQSPDTRPSDVVVTLPGAGTSAIGFQYGSYNSTPGTPVTITLSTGDVFTQFFPPNAGMDTNFIGFVSTAPITSVTLQTIPNVLPLPPATPFAYSLDIVSFTLAPAAAVPEPSTWGLMIAGLAFVGVAARRRTVKN